MENEIKKRKKVQKYPNQFALLLRNLKSDSDSNIKPLWKAKLPKILENIKVHFLLENKENHNFYILEDYGQFLKSALRFNMKWKKGSKIWSESLMCRILVQF